MILLAILYMMVSLASALVPVQIHRHFSPMNRVLSMSTTDPPLTFQPTKSPPSNIFTTLWKFSRPHTILGSGLSVLSVFAYATPVHLWQQCIFWRELFHSMLPALFMNLYITGLNQVTDVDIDKINKPYLPIAAGDLSLNQGRGIVLSSLLVSLALAYHSPWPLQATLVSSALLGTMYSLPPFRLKRFPLFAALCILVVRGSIVNIGFFLQAKTTLQSAAIPSLMAGLRNYPECLGATLFFALFGIVIAIMKDVPDVKGDALYAIPTFSVKIGAAKVFRLSWTILVTLLASTSIASVLFARSVTSGMGRVAKVVLAGGLAVMAWDVRRRALVVESESSEQVFSYYMYIWNIFYACYFLLPLAKI